MKSWTPTFKIVEEFRWVSMKFPRLEEIGKIFSHAAVHHAVANVRRIDEGRQLMDPVPKGRCSTAQGGRARGSGLWNPGSRNRN